MKRGGTEKEGGRWRRERQCVSLPVSDHIKICMAFSIPAGILDRLLRVTHCIIYSY